MEAAALWLLLYESDPATEGVCADSAIYSLVTDIDNVVYQSNFWMR